MKSTTFISFAVLAAAHLANAAPAPATTPAANTATPQSVSVSYDQKYDVGTTSLDTVACSDGTYGLETDGFTTFSSLPNFPLIGGAPTVAGWDSPNCGQCYQLTFESDEVSETINVLAVDSASGGFNIGLTAMNHLTDNQAVQLGHVTATYVAVANSVCGLED
ncbi:Cerato-platanin [Penicillium malachiteum]|uniref:Cerato-platanin n=1 Tax=Penicillium malachiteum TaxID=1324776 RepID=UPI0025494543|nr:Cerato-platanin [Penicillium malachiteum]KAJ5729492.1 Cerato-platanin [Penicillium malachiteum]